MNDGASFSLAGPETSGPSPSATWRSIIEIASGNIGPVAIGGNLDSSAEIYAYYGNIASVKIGGDLDHGAHVKIIDGGNIGRSRSRAIS